MKKKYIVVYDRLKEKYLCMLPEDMFKYHYNLENMTPQTVIPRLKIIKVIEE